MSIISEDERKKNLIDDIAFLTSTGDGSAKESLIDFVAFAQQKNQELIERDALPSIETVLQESLEKLDIIKGHIFEYEEEKKSYKVWKTSLFSNLFSTKVDYVDPDPKKNPTEYEKFRRAERNLSDALGQYSHKLHQYGEKLGGILRFSLLSPDVKTAIKDRIHSKNSDFSGLHAIWEAYYQSKLIDDVQAMDLLKKYTPDMTGIPEDIQARFRDSYQEAVAKPFDVNGDERNSLDKDYMSGLLSCMYAVNSKNYMPAYIVDPHFFQSVYFSDKNMAAYLDDVQHAVACVNGKPAAFPLDQIKSIHDEVIHDMHNLKKAGFKVGSYWKDQNKLPHLSWADGQYNANRFASYSLRHTFDGVLKRHALNQAIAPFEALLADENMTGGGSSVHTSPAIIFKGRSPEGVQEIIEDVKYTKAVIGSKRTDLSFDLKPEGEDTKLYVVYAADGDDSVPNMLINAFNELAVRKAAIETQPVASNENQDNKNENNENNGIIADSPGIS